MSADQARIAAGIARAAGGVVDDLTARLLAGAWHAGLALPLYRLASTGAVTAGVERELRQGLGTGHDQELQALLRYVATKGPRGPQPGWPGLGARSA